MMDGLSLFTGRREDRRLLTGIGRYTADHDRAGQLHGVYVRSDRAHARIVSLDLAGARAAPGVALVLTGAETREAGHERDIGRASAERRARIGYAASSHRIWAALQRTKAIVP